MAMMTASPRGLGEEKNHSHANKCMSERKNADKSRWRPESEDTRPWKGLTMIMAMELMVRTIPACAEEKPMDSVIIGTPHIMMNTRLA